METVWKQRIANVLPTILYALFLAISAFIGTNIRFADWSGPFLDAAETAVFALAQLVLGAFLIYQVHVKEGRPVRKEWVILSAVTFLVFVLSSFSMSDVITNEHGAYSVLAEAAFDTPDRIAGVYTLGSWIRFNEICYGFSLALFLYVSLGVSPYLNRSRHFDVFPCLIIVLALVMTVASPFVEPQNWAAFFVKGRLNLASFSVNKNVYGSVLLFACGASAILGFEKKQSWYGLLSFLFGAMSFLCGCKTAAVLCWLYLVCLAAYSMRQGIREKNRRLLIVTLALSAAVTVFAIFVCFGSLFPDGSFFHGINDAVFGHDLHVGTLRARYIHYWAVLGHEWELDPHYLWFGMGQWSYHFYMGSFTHYHGVGDFFVSHNSYVELLGVGGIFYLLVEMALIGYVGYLLYRSFRRKDPGFLGYAAMAAFLFFRGFVESNPIASIAGESFACWLLLFPLLRRETEARDEEAIAPIPVDLEAIVLPFVAFLYAFLPSALSKAFPFYGTALILLGLSGVPMVYLGIKKRSFSAIRPYLLDSLVLFAIAFFGGWLSQNEGLDYAFGLGALTGFLFLWAELDLRLGKEAKEKTA